MGLLSDQVWVELCFNPLCACGRCAVGVDVLDVVVGNGVARKYRGWHPVVGGASGTYPRGLRSKLTSETMATEKNGVG